MRSAELEGSKNELRDRTKSFALRIVRMFMRLPKNVAAQTLGKQALRSGTSVAANYREACRSRSNNEFVAKLGIVEQELDETLLLLELIVEAGIVSESTMASLKSEAEELLKITIASIRTAKRRT
jgi:four helix bundle protein